LTHVLDIPLPHLHPATYHSDPIVVTVLHHKLAENLRLYSNLRYEAVSYAWGDDIATERVTVDSPSRLQSLQVRKNVSLMLRYLRSADNPRQLWIDAVCIDQTNIQEKEHQVQRMGHIYSRADRVLIWLGTT
jgi:hypothetical protein